MSIESDIMPVLKRIEDASPSGFAIAFHVTFTTPDFLFQTYRKDWMDYYSEHGLVMQDPVVRWGFSNLGKARWADFEAEDEFGVLEKAREFGIVHGSAYAIEEAGSRSFAGFARADREYTDAEIDALAKDVAHLHRITSHEGKLTPDARSALKNMSVKFTHPERRPN
ncbi:autoinducer binding domain-containing protein [Aestuariibius sp. HNIBRBA575]|uniref:autoinducer binding domain-containing protein n=1 Tax=Aestuariibius sp. HNIBRBA575 TaxID=3233343 RepID=UPI0034A23E2C